MSIDPSIYESKLLSILSNNVKQNFQEKPTLTLTERNRINRTLKENFNDNLRYFKNASFIGAGGVASWFLPQYIKSVFNYRKTYGISDDNIFQIVIYDYDTVENKNILRQNFILEDVGKNKAQVLSERYNEIYPGIKVLYQPYYLFCENFFEEVLNINISEDEIYGDETKYKKMEFPYNSSFIFNFVDNEFTKHQIDFYLNEYEQDDFYDATIPSLYLTTGCDISNGQVFCRKFHYSKYYTEYYKDITFNRGVELIDEPLSCAEIAETAAAEQTFDSNAFAATILNTLVNNLLNNFWSTHAQEIKFISSGNPKVDTINNMENYNYLNYLDTCHSI